MKPTKKLKNRLLILLLEKSRQEGRRIPQSELAKAIGVSNNTISNWTGNKMEKLETKVIEGLCAYFECDVADLLYFEDTPENQDKAT